MGSDQWELRGGEASGRGLTMTEDLMKISQVSRALQVPVPTLRRWTREFADGLSHRARGQGSADRLFTLDDLAFLRRVKMTMAKADVTYEAARAQLGLAAAPASATSSEVAPPTEEERRQVSRYVRSIVEDVVAPYRRQIEKLEALVAEQGQQLAQMRTLLEELSEDAARTGRGPRRTFPWAR